MTLTTDRLDSSNLGTRLSGFSPPRSHGAERLRTYSRTPARAESSPAHNSPAAAYPVAGLLFSFGLSPRLVEADPVRCWATLVSDGPYSEVTA